jgi:hypothetical protein
MLLAAGGVHAQATPAITSVAPSSGPEAGGTNIIIQGTAFTGASAVRIGGLDATSFSVMDDSTITAVTPPSSPGGKIVQVITPGGVASTSGNAFSYTAAPQPQQPLIDADIDLDTPGSCSADEAASGLWLAGVLGLPIAVAMRVRRLAVR